MAAIRTDLALEIMEDLKRNGSENGGIEWTTQTRRGLTLDRVFVKDETGEKRSGKPRGVYDTLEVGKVWLADEAGFRERVLALRDLLREAAGKKPRSVLVAGLGNRSITADNLGPETVKNLIITRHLRKVSPAMFSDLGLTELSAVTPGVLGQTGIESADVIAGVTRAVEPDLIVAVDALCAREWKRLVTTVQLSTAGIRPGSGVGNERPEITEARLGVPVISVGVPTVVDAATLAADVIRDYAGSEAAPENLRAAFGKTELNFFVTPKETDQVIRRLGALIGYAVNLAWNDDLSYEDMLGLME
ncbi:MAG: GPR endopeptidase [Clostridia bacterium]|nr:GPR endopeptidase [Clostridia bacterium]